MLQIFFPGFKKKTLKYSVKIEVQLCDTTFGIIFNLLEKYRVNTIWLSFNYKGRIPKENWLTLLKLGLLKLTLDLGVFLSKFIFPKRSLSQHNQNLEICTLLSKAYELISVERSSISRNWNDLGLSLLFVS